MIKSSQLKYFAVFIMILSSCSTEKDNFELKDWLAERDLMKTKAVAFHSDCDSLISLRKHLQDEEFKANLDLLITKCYVQKGDEKNAKIYLERYLSAGKHISWLNNPSFSSILPTAPESAQLNESFWIKKDTFYFSEIEKRVQLDQAYVQEDELRNKIFKRNSEFLFKITDSLGGFPWQPGPNNFERNDFRVGIKPDLIAVHAPIEDKIIHQNNAIEAARKREISWRVPVDIGVTFFTQRSRGDVMPLRFLHFDQQNRLNVKDSYVELYSIKKYLQDNGLSTIKFQASIENAQKGDVIIQQLQDLKIAMVGELGWPEEAIEISSAPNAAENFQKDQQKGTYNYTFTAF